MVRLMHGPGCVSMSSCSELESTPQSQHTFQAIQRLTLTNGSGRPSAVAMESCVGEESVPFAAPLVLEGKVHCAIQHRFFVCLAFTVPQVESYMAAVVDCMHRELRRITQEAIADDPTGTGQAWLARWPSQVCLLVNQARWTADVEAALAAAARDPGALQRCLDAQVDRLTQRIEATRRPLSKGDRQKVMNAITMDAHNRDVVALLVEDRAASPACFQWQSQLRFYWDAAVSDVRIRVCDAVFPYGYEYMGNGPRLVVTPLTDRIYITATQVFSWWLLLCVVHSDNKKRTTTALLHHCVHTLRVGMLAVHGDRPRWPGRHRQNRNHQGSWQCPGQAGVRLQLCARDGLPHHGRHLQGLGCVWCVKLLVDCM